MSRTYRLGDARRVLNVTGHATEEEIRKAYKRAALKAHPDKGGSAEAFQRV
eukprot:CAMPEP_0119273290 /NCGR_PEP_ID=MMETSP1329-20130426/9976_1 /TAXON_ID=114041 /ORGANISM="Genus nov. species nov., Strain RCC1024" /LENGTH=50 /DNA_ID=CAMNT_0007273479 /DNA_START=120 /DNA_END=268 /DNA_ORIENTATION=+